MGPALGRRNQVYVALRYGLAALDGPREGPIDGLVLAGDVTGVRLGRKQLLTADRLQKILFETARVTPLEFFLRLLDLEAHGQSRAQHGFCAQRVLKT